MTFIDEQKSEHPIRYRYEKLRLCFTEFIARCFHIYIG
jgi:hypothetical protein